MSLIDWLMCEKLHFLLDFALVSFSKSSQSCGEFIENPIEGDLIREPFGSDLDRRNVLAHENRPRCSDSAPGGRLEAFSCRVCVITGFFGHKGLERASRAPERFCLIVDNYTKVLHSQIGVGCAGIIGPVSRLYSTVVYKPSTSSGCVMWKTDAIQGDVRQTSSRVSS